MEKNNKPEIPVMVISDDALTSDDPYIGGWTKRPDDWVEPTMAERLKKTSMTRLSFSFSMGVPVLCGRISISPMTIASRPREKFIRSQ